MNDLLYDTPHLLLLKAFMEIGGDTQNVSAKTENDVSNQGSSHVEANRSSDSIRVWNKASNIDMQIVPGIRIGLHSTPTVGIV